MKIILLILANIAITVITIGMINDDDNRKGELLLKSLPVILGVGVIIFWVLLLWGKVL